MTNTTNIKTYDVTGLDLATTNLDAPIRVLAEDTAAIANRVAMPQQVIVHACATGNVNLASPGTSIDSINFTAGRLYALPAQDINTQNMIYKWTGSALVVDEWSQFLVEEGFLIGFQVEAGNINKQKIFKNVTSPAPVFGTNAVIFEDIGVDLTVSADAITDEAEVQEATGVAIGDWVALDGNDKLVKARAGSADAALYKAVGKVVTAATQGSKAKFVRRGKVSISTSSYTSADKDKNLYLDKTTLGAETFTAPSTTGEYVVHLGYVCAAKTVFVQVDSRIRYQV